MGMRDNIVTVCGNVTRDPELTFTNQGKALAKFGLADNNTWTDKSTGQKHEDVSFFEVAVWGQQAENVAESIAKGLRVIVHGRLDQRSWDAEDGSKRSAVSIVADVVAPSLQWATAKVVRNESTDRPATTGTGSYHPDEEPF